jgi:uncharacterized protein involved in exopolysaccharide biosynthesis
MEKESEIIYLLTFLKKHLKQISLFVAGGMVIGFLLAILNPSEYRTELSFLIERDNNLPSMGGLVGITGLSFRSNNENISPELYPNILQSPDFALALKDEYFPVENNDTIRLTDYLNDLYVPSLRERASRTVSWLFGLFKSDRKTETAAVLQDDGGQHQSIIKELSPEEQRIINYVKKNIVIERDKANGLVILRVFHQDRFFSAGLASFSFEYLKDALSENRVEKSRRKFEFINSQYDSAYQKFNEAHIRLANFRDRNRNVASAIIRTQEEKLSLEFNQTSAVINSLAVQREESRIAFEEQTPIFSVISPAILQQNSLKRPSNLVFILIFSFLGFITGFAYFFYKAHLRELFKNI